MFFIWGSKWKYEVKPGGLRVDKTCPECDCRGTFIEVKPTKYFTAYFIPLFETESKRTVLECPHCKSHFYIKESDYLSAQTEWERREAPPKNTKSEPKVEKVLIVCEHCGKNLRVPLLDKLILATCPSCKRKFHVASGEII